MSEGRISSHDVVKVKILEVCKKPMSINEISKKVGLKRRSVQTNMLLLADYLIPIQGYPTKYLADPAKKFEPRTTNQKARPTHRYFPDEPGPLPYDPKLSRMLGYTDLVPPVSDVQYSEKHIDVPLRQPYRGISGCYMRGD